MAIAPFQQQLIQRPTLESLGPSLMAFQGKASGFGMVKSEPAGIFGGLISFNNWTPVETKIDSYPLSYNVVHTDSAAPAPLNRRLYQIASCAEDTSDGPGSGSNNNWEGGSEIFTTDPLKQDPCDSPVLIDISGDAIEYGE